MEIKTPVNHSRVLIKTLGSDLESDSGYISAYYEDGLFYAYMRILKIEDITDWLYMPKDK